MPNDAVHVTCINKLNRCLTMEIAGELRRRGQLLIKFSLLFGEAVISHELGEVAVGITDGELELELKNVMFKNHLKYGTLHQ